MTTMQKDKKQDAMIATSSVELENLIENAIKKVGARNETELCKYLPMPDGYMHHFTLRKMKHKHPEELTKMINTFIIETQNPQAVPPKQRAPRGSKKRKDHIVLTKTELDDILALARNSGLKDIVSKLVPKRELRTIKRELSSAIRNNIVDQELWNAYCESVCQQS